MQGTVDIDFKGHDFIENPNRTAIPQGPLKLPEGMNADGGLVFFGENDEYLHCIVAGTGQYLGVFKSEDPNHIFQYILKLNDSGQIDATAKDAEAEA